ncbi:7TM diverse intracellular signaling domain-containing protein [Arcobacter arenosus]|uniref:histidine kinase n=1 Tax=Arcobacter arenosus TaxID=2576037 RepID=A0A5R8Y334_9BACT|nr:7TM diverse intracellular signaling domain-containing protein [Arcobacter arenosus]TLP40517.1 hypothetical protein FDK22_00455 [Arcobacter arenosus]
MKFYRFVFLLTLIIIISLNAQDFSIHKEIQIFITTKKLKLEEAKNSKFDLFSKEHINYGFNSDMYIWLKVNLKNLENKPKDFILEINNPLLEHIILYYDDKINTSGMLHIDKREKYINPSFTLSLKANETKTYYLNIKNSTTALQFSILISDLENFKNYDLLKQFLIVFFIGVILAFITYSFSLFIYTKEKSYLYYCIYILTLLFQQLTYIGFLPLYAPQWFTNIDNLIVVPKVGIMIITAAIFARSFLKTSNYSKIDKIYKFVIYFILLQILFLSTPVFYFPEVTVLTGLFFIFFNLYSSIYIYNKGNKQARFFIIGWTFLSIGYFLSIIDALGIISVMYFLPPLILILTLIEALFLLLAFIDRLSILQNEKLQLDKKLYEELEKRNIIVEKEVKKQTKSLKNLYRELHHRVKNNLQIILSILNLQSSKLDNRYSKDEFLKLENRIKAISKTHEILYQNDNIEIINMKEYIKKLCMDLNISYSLKDIDFKLNIDANMPIKEAVYVGIIINELLSNSIKYVNNLDRFEITLIKKAKEYFLEVADNGLGYDFQKMRKNSLGLSLVYGLVTEQLGGEIESKTKDECKYMIRFKI